MPITIDLSNYQERNTACEIIRTTTDGVIVDLSKIKFLFHANDISHIKCIVTELEKCSDRHNDRPKVIAPKDPLMLKLLNDTGIFSSSGSREDMSVIVKNFGDNVTIVGPCYVADDDNDELADTILAGHNLTSDYALHNIITELSNNIHYHSGNEYSIGNGFVSSNYFKTLGLLEVAFVDLGIGFKGSYVRTGKDNGRGSSELITASFGELVSSVVDKYRGIGLFETVQFLQERKGELWVHSFDGVVSISESGKIKQYDNPMNVFIGTNIFLRMKL